jgi:hypothetical protein
MSESVAALSRFTDVAIGHYIISRGLMNSRGETAETGRPPADRDENA